MIFLLDTVNSFLSCVGNGTVFIKKLENPTLDEDLTEWVLSGFSHITPRAEILGWAYCTVVIDSDVGVEDFRVLLASHWKLFQGFVCESYDFISENDGLDKLPSPTALTKEELQAEIQISSKAIQAELVRRESMAKVQQQGSRVQAKVVENPGVTTPPTCPPTGVKKPPVDPSKVVIIDPPPGRESITGGAIS